jgi:hypothetical protein
MGTSRTPTYIVEMTAKDSVTGALYAYIPAPEWYARKRGARVADGQPRDCAALAAYVRRFEASTLPGAVNAHLGAQTVVSARVVRQADREVCSTYRARHLQLVGS